MSGSFIDDSPQIRCQCALSAVSAAIQAGATRDEEKVGGAVVVGEPAEVWALDYLLDGELCWVETGTWEQRSGRLWAVVGIFAPAADGEPWVVQHAARHDEQVVLLRPFMTIASEQVVAVHGFVGPATLCAGCVQPGR